MYFFYSWKQSSNEGIEGAGNIDKSLYDDDNSYEDGENDYFPDAYAEYYEHQDNPMVKYEKDPDDVPKTKQNVEKESEMIKQYEDIVKEYETEPHEDEVIETDNEDVLEEYEYYEHQSMN